MYTAKCYSDAKRILDSGLTRASRQRRRVAHGTYLVRHENDDIALSLHDHDIVVYHPDASITLDHCGWKTQTTRNRINAYTPYPLSITSWSGVWGLQLSTIPGPAGYVVFEPGVTVRLVDGATYTSGSVWATDRPGKSFLDAVKEYNRMIGKTRRYAKAYVNALLQGEIDNPGPSDCWFCLLLPSSAVGSMTIPIGDQHGRNEHLIDHMKERYFVPSLIVNAIRDSRWSISHLLESDSSGKMRLKNGLYNAVNNNAPFAESIIAQYLRKHLAQ